MHLKIYHLTRYQYPSPVTGGHNEIRLFPFSDEQQSCIKFDIDLRPSANVHKYESPSGVVHHFNVAYPHDYLDILVRSEVETFIHNPFDRLNLIENDWDYYLEPSVRRCYADLLGPTPLVTICPELMDFVSSTRRAEDLSVASFLLNLNQHIYCSIKWEPGSSHVGTTAMEALNQRKGVCQDFSHIMLAACRWMGIPCRYVSGYAYDGGSGASLHADHAMHAWVECLMPGGFWRGFDPTNNLMANASFVKVHTGRDFQDITPVKGLYTGPAEHELITEVRISGQ